MRDVGGSSHKDNKELEIELKQLELDINASERELEAAEKRLTEGQFSLDEVRSIADYKRNHELCLRQELQSIQANLGSTATNNVDASQIRSLISSIAQDKQKLEQIAISSG